MSNNAKPDLRPMREFDPAQPAMVHDQLNDDTFEWVPEKYREHYERYAEEWAPGIIEWDGLLLDGWSPVAGWTNSTILQPQVRFCKPGGVTLTQIIEVIVKRLDGQAELSHVIFDSAALATLVGI